MPYCQFLQPIRNTEVKWTQQSYVVYSSRFHINSLTFHIVVFAGAKLRGKIGLPFGNPPQGIGFPKQLQGFRKCANNYIAMDITLKQHLSMVHTIFTGFPVGNPVPNFGFP